MKKIFGILSVFLFPVVSFAQNYGYKMMDYNYNNDFVNNLGCNSAFWFLPFVFLIPVFGILLAIGLFIFWVKMLIDAIKHSPESTKIVWVLVIIFTHIIGAFIYYFVEFRSRHKTKIHTEHKKEEGK